jgi:hypothetical protein
MKVTEANRRSRLAANKASVIESSDADHAAARPDRRAGLQSGTRDATAR